MVQPISSANAPTRETLDSNRKNCGKGIAETKDSRLTCGRRLCCSRYCCTTRSRLTFSRTPNWYIYFSSAGACAPFFFGPGSLLHFALRKEEVRSLKIQRLGTA